MVSTALTLNCSIPALDRIDLQFSFEINFFSRIDPTPQSNILYAKEDPVYLSLSPEQKNLHAKCYQRKSIVYPLQNISSKRELTRPKNLTANNILEPFSDL